MRIIAGALAIAAASATAGCGGVRAADLFLVTRTGGGSPQASLTLLVDEEGGVRCNGRAGHKLSDAMLVQARALQEELHDYAARSLSLAPRPGSVYSYVVRDADGSVRFSDDSAGQPAVLRRMTLFVLETAQRSCGLPQ